MRAVKLSISITSMRTAHHITINICSINYNRLPILNFCMFKKTTVWWNIEVLPVGNVPRQRNKSNSFHKILKTKLCTRTLHKDVTCLVLTNRSQVMLLELIRSKMIWFHLWQELETISHSLDFKMEGIWTYSLIHISSMSNRWPFSLKLGLPITLHIKSRYN